jgi:Phasin protein
METKGKRSSRAAGAIQAPAEPAKPLEAQRAPAAPVPAPAEPAKPIETQAAPPDPVKAAAKAAERVETSVAAEPAGAPTQPPTPEEILAEAAEPAETAVELVTTAASAPRASAGALVRTSQTTSPGDLSHVTGDGLVALTRSQAALARGLGALSVEFTGLVLSGIQTAARTAAEMLRIKTLSDAIEVNAGFACRSVEALVGGSAKLSELGMKLAAETSEPILAEFGKGWRRASRSGS